MTLPPVAHARRERVRVRRSSPSGRRSSATGPCASRTQTLAGSCPRRPTGCRPSAAIVFVYQVRPWSMISGAVRHCSVPYGSNAFGQPFQPAIGARLRPPGLPRADQVGVAPVGAAVEDGAWTPVAVEARLPRVGEVVRLGVEHVEALERLEVRPLERRRLRNGTDPACAAVLRLDCSVFFVGAACRAPGRSRAAEPVCLNSIGFDATRRRSTLRELRELLDVDLADDEAAVARRRDVRVGQQRLDRGNAAARGDEDRDGLGRTALEQLLELRAELRLALVGRGHDRVRPVGARIGRGADGADHDRCRRQGDGQRNEHVQT